MGDPAHPLLRTQRRRRRAIIAALLVILVVLLISWRTHPPIVTDHARYHQRTGRVIDVVEGDLLRIEIASRQVLVRLLGCDSDGREDARQITTEAVAGAIVQLYLEDVPTRNAAGELLAYAYAEETLLNELLVEKGAAFADRRFEYTFRQSFERVEEQALRQRQGLWAGLSEGHDPPMPEWRRRWLTQHRKPPWERVEWRRPGEP